QAPPAKIMQPADPGPAAPRAAFDVSAYFQQRCASCHEAKVADAKGKGLVLWHDDGSAVRLTKQQADAIVREVVSGHMPLNRPAATAAEAAGLAEALASLKYDVQPAKP